MIVPKNKMLKYLLHLMLIYQQTAFFLEDKLPDASPGLISTGRGQFLYPLGQCHVQSPPTEVGFFAIPGIKIRRDRTSGRRPVLSRRMIFYDRLSTQLFRLCALCRPLRIFPSRMVQDAATLPRRPSTASPWERTSLPAPCHSGKHDIDYTAEEGRFLPYKGRSYCWLRISGTGVISLTKEMMDFLRIAPGTTLLSIRSSDIAFTMGARGPLLEKAEIYHGEIPEY